MNDKLYIKKLGCWNKLWKKEKLNKSFIEEYVNFFSKSPLPNSWFLQQFNNDKNVKDIFRFKGNWELFALVLVDRGISKLNENLIDLLEFLYEPYYTSYKTIQQFILNNYSTFNPIIIKFIQNASSKNDYLLIDDIVNALCDIDLFYNTKEYKRLSNLLDDVSDNKILYNDVSKEILELINYLLNNFLIKITK